MEVLSRSFGPLVFGQLAFGQLAFGQLVFGQLTFGELEFGQLTFGQLTFVRFCLHEQDLAFSKNVVIWPIVIRPVDFRPIVALTRLAYFDRRFFSVSFYPFLSSIIIGLNSTI